MALAVVTRDKATENRIYFKANINTYIEEDGSGNLSFTDSVSGTKSLATLGYNPPSTITVSSAPSADYSTISAAIAAAGPNDLIEVFSGTYTEDLTIDKNLVIRGQGSKTIVSGKHTFSASSAVIASISFITFVSTDEECFDVSTTHNDANLKIYYCNLISTYTTVVLPSTTVAKSVFAVSRGQIDVENCTISLTTSGDNVVDHSTAVYYTSSANQIALRTFHNKLTLVTSDANQLTSQIHNRNTNVLSDMSLNNEICYFTTNNVTTSNIYPLIGSVVTNGFQLNQNVYIVEVGYRFKFCSVQANSNMDIVCCQHFNNSSTITQLGDNTGGNTVRLIDCRLDKSGLGVTTGNFVYTYRDTNGKSYSNADHANTAVTTATTVVTNAINPTNDITITCPANKTLVLAEPVWDDLPPVPILRALAGASAPTLTTFKTLTKQYTFGIGNIIYGSSELVHGYKEGTDIYPHVHWSNQGVDGTDRDVQWQLTYSLSDTTYSAETTIAVNSTILSTDGDRTDYISVFPVISGGACCIGDYIIFEFRRIANTGVNAEPSNNPFVIAVGFHVQKDTLGSRQIGTK